MQCCSRALAELVMPMARPESAFLYLLDNLLQPFFAQQFFGCQAETKMLGTQLQESTTFSWSTPLYYFHNHNLGLWAIR